MEVLTRALNSVPKVHSLGVKQWMLEAFCCYPGSLLIEWGSQAPPPSLSKPAFQLGGAPIASFFLSLHLRGGLEPGADQSLRQYLAALPINQVKEKGALRSCSQTCAPDKVTDNLGPSSSRGDASRSPRANAEAEESV